MSRGTTVFVVALLLTAVGALAVRLPRLERRVMHCDEANQAVRAGILYDGGAYRYDPDEHHGPTLYWLTLPALKLGGADSAADSREIHYRIVPVLFGAALVLLLLAVADGLGRVETLVAGLLVAASPAMVYYSRYYVQETLLVFFTFAAIACAWRYVRSGRTVWAVFAGLSLGLMHATKETWIISGAAMLGAAGFTIGWTRWQTGRMPALPRRWLPWVAALLAAVVVAVALYSSFGSNWRGPLDSLLAYRTYFQRGSRPDVHGHPWHFYAELLLAFRPARGFFWSEGLIGLLALCGGAAAFLRFRRDPQTGGLLIFLAVYTVLLTTAYCLIRYKTPWCLLGFWHGAILLAGVGGVSLVRAVPRLPVKLLVAALLLAGYAHLAWECYWLNFRLEADPRNPYVYAHTSPDVLKLAAMLERLAGASPEGREMTIHVVTPENYWPLPWYVRRFDAQRIGYWPDAAAWSRDSAAGTPPDVLLFTPDVQAAIDAALPAAYHKQMLYGLRPGVLLMMYVREPIWAGFLAREQPRTRSRNQEGKGTADEHR